MVGLGRMQRIISKQRKYQRKAMQSPSQENNYETLKIIRGISVTRREIDTIACLLSGKGVKSIASLLSMSPRTVETYTRSLMLKFGCNSREGIIRFVEKSDQFKLFKKSCSS